MVQAYCVKCGTQVEVLNGKETTTKNGRRMLKGTCSKDGKTTVCKFLPSKK